MPVLFSIKDHFQETKLFFNRTIVAILVITGLTTTLIVRTLYLQISQHDLYTTLSRNNQVSIVPVRPTRGLIYDRNGILLADNVPAFSLEIMRKHARKLTNELDELQKIIQLSPHDLENFQKQIKFKRNSDSVTLKANLNEEEVARFSVEKLRFPRVEVVARLIRRYPHKNITAHALGYVGPISENDLVRIDTAKYRGTQHIGKTGLEYSYEGMLHGEPGYQQIETNVRGQVVQILSYTPPQPGKNLYLSIDIELQKRAVEALSNLGRQNGALVAIDPSTGDVLALVSKPSFDPNIFVKGIDVKSYKSLQKDKGRPLFNRALQGQYAPASTVKPLAALRALELGIVNPKTHIFDPGWFRLHEDGRLYRDWKRKGHGWVNLQAAIEESCSTYFFQLANKMGIDNLNNIFDRFGLGRKTGIDIVGELSGINPSRKWKEGAKNQPWYAGDTLNVGIGQGYTLVTPIQIATVATIIGNRGVKPKPRIVRSIGNESSQTQVAIEQPEKIDISDKHWSFLIKAMQRVLRSPSGTAHRIRTKHYTIAGKTGTGQVYSLKQDEEYDEKITPKHLRDNSWFMAFAPVDKPKIAIAVIIENGHGGTIVAKKVLNKFFKVE